MRATSLCSDVPLVMETGQRSEEWLEVTKSACSITEKAEFENYDGLVDVRL